MKLAHIKTTGIGALADATYSMLDGKGKVSAVTAIGGAGPCGKTTLLEAIVLAKEAVGPYGGPPRHLARLRRGDVEVARVEARFVLNAAERAQTRRDVAELDVVVALDGDRITVEGEPSMHVRAFLSDTSPAPACGGLHYFPADRRLGEPMRNTAAGPLFWLSPDQRRFGALVPWLVDELERDAAAMSAQAADDGVVLGVERRRLGAVREALRPFVPRLALRGGRRVDGIPELLFTDRAGRTVSGVQLSASERDGVVFALSLLSRPPQHGLVLIDTPELHAGVASGVGFFATIAELCPDAQIVAATGAPDVAAVAARALALEARP